MPTIAVTEIRVSGMFAETYGETLGENLDETLGEMFGETLGETLGENLGENLGEPLGETKMSVSNDMTNAGTVNWAKIDRWMIGRSTIGRSMFGRHVFVFCYAPGLDADTCDVAVYRCDMIPRSIE